jgi:hypothetical protein
MNDRPRPRAPGFRWSSRPKLDFATAAGANFDKLYEILRVIIECYGLHCLAAVRLLEICTVRLLDIG